MIKVAGPELRAVAGARRPGIGLAGRGGWRRLVC